MKLNEKLHSYRKKSGLSQQELAEQLDVSRQSVSKWETEITVPSVEKLILLSKLYNVPLTILTDDDVELKENTDLQPVTNTKKNPSILLRMGLVVVVAIVVISGSLILRHIGVSKEESLPLDEISAVNTEELGDLEKGDLSATDDIP